MRDDIKKNLVAQVHQANDLDGGLADLETASGESDADLEDLKSRSAELLSRLKEEGLAEQDKCPSSSKIDLTAVEEAPPPSTSAPLTYEEITTQNLNYLSKNGLLDAEFDSLFSAKDLQRIERELSSPIQREKWDRWDFAAVFVAGIAGVTADHFTGGVDNQLKEWFSGIKINADSNVAIDYQGPGFGGPYHRAMSPGHDILRIFIALWQIKTGNFVGLKQTVGGFEQVVAGVNQYGNPFNTYDGLEALIVWLKHLLSDFVTAKSLPVPGASFLTDMPNHEVRKFAIQLYQKGFNIRHLLAQALAPALVEVVVRFYILAREYRSCGEIKFPSAKSLKNTEMLLAAHAMVMAVNVGKVAVQCNAEGPLALRKLNIPSIVVTIRYFIPFVVKRMKLSDPVEILKRNAREIVDGYDRQAEILAAEMRSDTEFQAFLNNKQIIVV
ncbi:MAG: hypothetical protein ABIJ09_14755 [Pseudomonadota bacterium]